MLLHLMLWNVQRNMFLNSYVFVTFLHQSFFFFSLSHTQLIKMYKTAVPLTIIKHYSNI